MGNRKLIESADNEALNAHVQQFLVGKIRTDKPDVLLPLDAEDLALLARSRRTRARE